AAGAPPLRYVFPHAPERAVTINGGYVMRAWYDILGSELGRREDEAGLRASPTPGQALLDREIAHGIRAERVGLAGVSRGGAGPVLAGRRGQVAARSAQSPAAGRADGAVVLPAAGRSGGGGTQRRFDPAAHLHGARQRGSGDPAVARDRVARCAQGARLPDRV